MGCVKSPGRCSRESGECARGDGAPSSGGAAAAATAATLQRFLETNPEDLMAAKALSQERHRNVRPPWTRQSSQREAACHWDASKHAKWHGCGTLAGTITARLHKTLAVSLVIRPFHSLSSRRIGPEISRSEGSPFPSTGYAAANLRGAENHRRTK